MGQVERLLEIAKSDVGVKESPPNSNRCKFNTWYYGKEVSGSAYPWCMAAVQYWFNQAGLSSLIMRTASCTALMNWAKQRKQFVTSGYRPGDVALYQFDSDPESEHTGIIVSASGDTICAVEGNTGAGNDANGGAVMLRTRSVKTLLGAYRPPYEVDKGDEVVTQADFDKMMAVWLAARDKLGVADNRAPQEFEAAVKAKVTDGSRPQAFATRQEVAVMAYRAAQ